MNDSFKIWEGVYSSFAETGADQSAFQDETWLGKLVERAHLAIAKSETTAAVAAVTETRDYALPFVAATLARPNERLRILDFGGGIGTNFIQLSKMLPADQPLDYVVIENGEVCRHGRELLGVDHRVSFQSELPEKSEVFDIVHCGSSIEYVENWMEILNRFSDWRPAFVLFVNLPAADNLTFITTQNYHGKRIPVRFWNFQEFVAGLAKVGYVLALKSRFVGYWRDRYPEMPTGHFDVEYRAEYFTQLLFRRKMP